MSSQMWCAFSQVVESLYLMSIVKKKSACDNDVVFNVYKQILGKDIENVFNSNH